MRSTAFVLHGTPALALCLHLLAFAPPAAAADGDLDVSFSNDGQRAITWGGTAARATAAKAIPGGGLMVAGRLLESGEWAAAKLDTDGVVNSDWGSSFEPFDFSADGATWTYDVFDLHALAGGGLAMAGWVEAGEEVPRPALARLTAAGGLDPAFGGDGREIVEYVLPGFTLTSVRDAGFLDDGRAYFTGTCAQNAEVWGCILLVLANGQPDPSFSGDGWMIFRAVSGFASYPMALATGLDNSVTVAGLSSSAALANATFTMRATQIGTLHGSYGGVGVSPLVDLSPSAPQDVAIDPDTGRVAVAMAVQGSGISGGGILAFTGSGNVDTGFSGTGFHDLDLEEGSRIDSVEFQSDGRLLAVGTINANGSQPAGFLLARLTTGGGRDNTFDDNGVKRVEFDRSSLAVDLGVVGTTWSGRLFAAGEAQAASLDPAFALLRTECALIFTDGFERGSAGGWNGQ